tara:strand:+ start:952 stop:1146 length:195 start_codon:yes stop_codon:yes gene_type:complete
MKTSIFIKKKMIFLSFFVKPHFKKSKIEYKMIKKMKKHVKKKDEKKKQYKPSNRFMKTKSVFKI